MLRALVTSFKIPGFKWRYHSVRWEAFADILFPEDSKPRARSDRATSVLPHITTHETPFSTGAGYLLTEDDECDDNVDVCALSEYSTYIRTQPAHTEDSEDTGNASMSMGMELDEQVEQDLEEQASIDAQLNLDMYTYTRSSGHTVPVALSALEPGPTHTTPESEQTSQPDNLEINDTTIDNMNTAVAVQYLPKEVSPAVTHDPSSANSGARSRSSSPILVDLTLPELPATTTQTESQNQDEDGDWFVVEHDDDDCFIVAESRRALSIRSRTASVMETPTRPSRYARLHVPMLDDV